MKSSLSPLETRKATLCGREDELARLSKLGALIQQESCCRQVAFIHGHSGCGKTYLCSHIQSSFASSHHFALGKFDQYQDGSYPYSALVQALESLLTTEENEARLTSLTAHVKESLGEEALVLCKLVPSFSRAMGFGDVRTSSETNVYTARAYTPERLQVALLAFLRAFCTMDHPLILVIDDLQWADIGSLNLLQTVAQAKEEMNLLLVGIYRDDPNTITVPLQHFLHNVSKERFVHDISVRNLDIDNTKALVLNLLSIEPDRVDEPCQALVDLIYQKTFGNPYFVLQFVGMLQRKQYLKFNYATMKWEWDLIAIKASTSVSDNVAAVLKKRVEGLNCHVLHVLELAACLGFVFSAELLEYLMNNIPYLVSPSVADDLDINVDNLISYSEAIEFALKEELIESSWKGFYCFTHDRIHQAVYEHIPHPRERDQLHWNIGMLIRKMTDGDAESRSKYLFLITSQLNRGSACIEDEQERLSLLRLNYEASLLALQRIGMDFVGVFLKQAMFLARESDWERCHDLLIDISNAMVQFEVSRGEHENAMEISEMIFSRANKPEDTIAALVSRFNMQFSRLNFSMAIRDGRRALDLCGEHLPLANIVTEQVALLRTKNMIKGRSDEELLRLPEMTEKRKKIATELYLGFAICGWQVNVHLFVLCILGSMQVTLRYGRNRYTPTVFTAFGSVVSSAGDHELGCRFAELGLRMQGKKKEATPDFIVYAYGTVLHTKLPFASLLEPFLSGYRKGLETGDTMYGSACLTMYIAAYIGTGLPLHTFTNDLFKFAKQLKLLGRFSGLVLMMPIMQFALNLCGQSENPLTISWETMKGHELLHNLKNPQDSPKAELILKHYQLFNAYLLRDAETASSCFQALHFHKNLVSQDPTNEQDLHHFHFTMFLLFDGLVGFWLGSLKGSLRHRRVAIRAIKSLGKRPSVNTLPLKCLLEAQKAATAHIVDLDHVEKLYHNVIVMSARSGLVHLGAIANEQFGEFLKKRESKAPAKTKTTHQHYILRAVELYEEWGASVKVINLFHCTDFSRREHPARALQCEAESSSKRH